jgi:hypothetical protein
MSDPEVTAEPPKYVSHKTVHALEIDSVVLVGGGGDLYTGERLVSFADAGYVPAKLPADMFARYQPVKGDFLVIYADGFKSFSPRKAFLEGYTRAA